MPEQEQQHSYWRKFWEAIGLVGNLQTLWQLAVSFGVATFVLRFLRGEWYQPRYVATAGFAFCGTWAILATVVLGVKKSIPVIKRYRHPHSLNIETHSGSVAALTLTHIGEPATWTVEGRIVRMLNKSPNFDPMPFRCDLSKDDRTYPSLLMHGGEWAQVYLASIGCSEWQSGSWLEIRCGTSDTRVPDSGVILELVIKAVPPQKQGPITKRFQIIKTSWGQRNLIEMKPGC